MSGIAIRGLALALPAVLVLAGCQVRFGPPPAGSQPAGTTGSDPSVGPAARLKPQVTRDESQPGKPVVEVSLHYTKTTDADLKDLAGLGQLRKLTLSSTPVTGVGLKALAGLKGLEQLDMSFSQASDEAFSGAALPSAQFSSLLMPVACSFCASSRSVRSFTAASSSTGRLFTTRSFTVALPVVFSWLKGVVASSTCR